MKHLFLIQCYKYHQARKLGNLIKSLSPNFDILYSYDENKEDKEFFEMDKSINKIPVTSGYYDIDLGFHQIPRYAKMNTLGYLDDFDFIHILPESVLPTKRYKDIDSISNCDLYIELYKVNVNGVEYNKANISYGISTKIAKLVSDNYFELATNALSVIPKFYLYNLVGGPDEYLIGEFLTNLIELCRVKYNLDLRIKDDNYRFYMWPGSEKFKTMWGGNISDYGVYKRSTSPLMLYYTDKLIKILEDRWDLFFGSIYSSEDEIKFINWLLNE